MWVPSSNIACRLKAYKNVLALIAPLKIPTQLCNDSTRMHVSFAISDPYLSRVSKFGLAEAISSKSLFDLILTERVGAILVTNHPHQNGPATEEQLRENWTSLLQDLNFSEFGKKKCGHASKGDALLLAPYVNTEQSAYESSAVELAEIDSWRALSGSPTAPGKGAAAVQLQGWLDQTCGGWPNSFG